MTESFAPRLDILPPPQRRLWSELVSVPPEFVLYGGTAVALHLAHRQSIDFDFFGDRDFDPLRLASSIDFLASAQVTQQERSTLSAIVERDGPVRISFFGLPRLPRLVPPHVVPDHGLKVASLLDLAAAKAQVVQARAEAKDYLDIDAILQDGRIDLPVMLASARAIHGPQFNPQITLKALAFFGDGNLASVPEDARLRLAMAVRTVDLDRLPMVPGP